MVRHIFIGTFRDGVNDDTKRWILHEMQAMKEKIPGIAAQTVGFSTGWAGPENQIVMTVDFPSKAAFDVYMQHLYNMEHIDRLGSEFFDRSAFTSALFEFEPPSA